VAGPGCSGCLVVADWVCSATACHPLCGDGVVGTGPDCAQAHRDTGCDVTGYWAARETNYTRDTLIGSVQTSSSWFLLRLQQTGQDFQVVEALDCGTHTTGTATADGTPGTLRGLIYRNRMDAAPHGPRHGSSTATGGGCTIALDRWYDVRGVQDSFLPPDFATHPDLASLPPLPSEADPVTATDTPPGSDDPDGDGIPGVASQVSGFVTGIRNEAQRDWKEYASVPGRPVTAGALTFSVPGGYDLQQNVLRVTECGTACSLIAAGARAAQDIPSRITLSFIGKAPGGPRVTQAVLAPPHQDLNEDLTTCGRMKVILPHDPSVP
jgi:hypothetical protein